MPRFHLLVVLGFAWAVGVQPAPVLKPGPSVILGRVVEAGTKTGVPGAIVTLSGTALGPPTAMFGTGVPGGPRRTSADAEGRFLFRDLPAGPYTMTSDAVGYVSGAYGRTRVVQFQRPTDVTRSLELTEADKLTAVSIDMWRKGGIGGAVVDEAGDPMIGTPITILARLNDWSGPVIQAADSVTTDDRGMYHADVAPGDYIVGVLAATTTVPASAVDGFVQAQFEGGAAMQSFMREVSASGSLLARGVGARVGDFLVSQFGTRNAWVVPPFVVQDGRLWFYPTTFHPSSLGFASASLVKVTSGEEKTGVDVRLQRMIARRVSGRVVGPNGPAGGMAVRLIAPDSSPAEAGIWSVSGDTPQALTNGNGAFTFLGVAPGSYVARALRVTAPGEPVLWAAESVTVGTETDVTDLTIRLQAGATIAGRLVVDGNGPAPSPNAIGAITIRPTPMPGSAGALMGPAGWVVRPDGNNRFITGQMVPGPYVLAVTALPGGWMVKSATAGGVAATDKAFELTTAGISDVVVTITDRVSSLAGIARDGSGQPAPSATVIVFPVNKALWVIPGAVSGRIKMAVPGRDGRYAISALPPGDYCVAAVDAASGDLLDSQVWTALMATASRVTITDGENKAQDLRVTVLR